MGCLLSKHNSRLDSKHTDLNTIRGDTTLMSTDLNVNGPLSNGNSIRTSIPSLENSVQVQNTTTTKPLSQIISQSQTEFFKMLEEKISKGNGDLVEDSEYSESER